MVMQEEASKYDRLHGWRSTQEDILRSMKNGCRDTEGVTLPQGLQLMTSLNHRSTMHWLTTLRGTSGDLFVTHSSKGSTHRIHIWTMKYGTRELHSVKFNVPTPTTQLIFIPNHRVFVGFCTDLTLRVFADVVHKFGELSVTLCPSSILCLAYNKESDELVTGGVGCLLRWSMSEYRDKLIETEPYNIEIGSDEWVQDLRFDYSTQQLMVQSDNAICFINYTTGDLLHYFPNHHSLSLSCAVSYRPRDYFITASKDGTIKVWNTIVFEQMYEFHGHFDVVTGLVMHPDEPLLISSSLDSSIRMWRLDTFELLQRIDMGEPILSLRLINPQEIAYSTETAVRVWRLNMYYSIFAEVQSTVEMMSRVTWGQDAARILIETQDGGVRLLSPRTGATLTIVYPLATHKPVEHMIYDRSEEKVYMVLKGEGEALVFSCASNPSTLLYKLVPPSHDKHIVAMATISRENHIDKEDQDENLIFSGHNDGTICLLQATRSVMCPIQAHNEPLTLLQASRGMRRPGTTLTGWYDRLVSASAVGTVKVWEVVQADIDGSITLVLLAKVSRSGRPNQLTMMANILAFSLHDKGTLFMYEVEDHLGLSRGSSVSRLKHEPEDDHTQELNGLDCCPGLQVFGSSGDDGYIKIWSSGSELMREISLDNSLRSMCFLSPYGDIVFGYQNHIYVVKVSNYLPLDDQERIILHDFKDDVKEEPLEFNHNLSLTLDCANIRTLPLDLEERRGAVCVRGAGSRGDSHTAGSGHAGRRGDWRFSDGDSFHNHLHKLNARRRTHSRLLAVRAYRLQQQEDALTRVNKTQSTILEADATDSRMSLRLTPKASSTGAASTEVKNTKRFWPIAPDGYIPNSVIRKAVDYKPPPEVHNVDTWTLKPVPKQVTFDVEKEDSDARSSSTLSDTPFMFNNEDDEPVDIDRQVTFDEEVEEREKAKERLVTPQITPSPKPAQQKPRTPQKVPKSPKTPTKAKRSAKKATMGISEEEDEEEDDCHPLLRTITNEQWFPRNTPRTVDNVVNSFTAFMSNVDDTVHTKICNYIVDIHKEKALGYTGDQLKTLTAKLKEQLQHGNATYRKNAVHTLTALGINDFKTILDIIPLLLDENEEVRKEAALALKKLAGVEDKDKLLHMFKDMGVLPEHSSRQDEDAALAELAAACAVDENKELNEMSDKVKAWMGSSSWEISFDDDEPRSRRNSRKKAEKQKSGKGERKSDANAVRLPDQDGNIPQSKETPRRRRKGTTTATDGSMTSSRTGKLLPNNAALYKTYDQQKSRNNTPQTEAATDDELMPTDNTETKLPAITEKRPLPVDDHDEKDTGIGTDLDSDVVSTFGPTSYEGSLPPLVRGDDMSAADSGIQSDDQSSHYGPTSLVRRGMPHLSPIKSSALVDPSERQTADFPENWRDFFDRPSAQNRRRLAEQRLAATESRGQGTVLPPIRYYDNGEAVAPPDEGVRLLQSVSVRDKARLHGDNNMAASEYGVAHKPVRVREVPSKLSVHTSLPNGMSKYGILNLRWTSGARGPEAELASGLPGANLPYLKDGRLSLSSQSVLTEGSTVLPGIMAARGDRHGEFVWQQPLPPAPGRGSRLEDPEIRKQHQHYCEYYQLLRKRMNDHTSPTSPQPSETKITVLKVKRRDINVSPTLPTTSLKMMLTCRT